MTIAVDLGRKATKQTKTKNNTCLTNDHKLISCFCKIKSSLCTIKIPQPFQITLISLIRQSWSGGYKVFMHSSNEHDIVTDIRNLNAGTLRFFSDFQHSGVAFILLIEVM